MKSLSLVFLLASAVQAQPFISDEVVWRTTSAAATYHPAAQAARIELDGDKLVVGWSEVEDGVSRVYAGRLDASGRLLTVGVHSSGTADGVSIAPFGDRYIAAWLEPEAVDQRPTMVTAALDRNFKLLSAHAGDLEDSPLIVRASATHAYVAAGPWLYELDGNATTTNIYAVVDSADDMVVAEGAPATISHGKSQVLSCNIGRGGCNLIDRYTLNALWLFRLSASATADFFKSNARAAIGARNDLLLTAWFEFFPQSVVKGSGLGTRFQSFVISQLGPTTTDALTQPQIASDGKLWIVIWPHGETILGVVFDIQGQMTPITVTQRGSRAAIAAVRPGRFVVTYEVVDGGARNLASRVIDFNPPTVPGHGRAIR